MLVPPRVHSRTGRHPVHPPRPIRAPLSGALVAALLCALPACTSRVRPGEETSLRVAFANADGPRTPEGARLQGEVVLRVALDEAAPRTTREELERRVRSGLIEVLERRLAEGGIDVARQGLEEDARWILARDGIDVRSIDAATLGLADGGRRDEIQPTTDLRILLVGLDGYDWDIAEPLMAAGRMPALTDLVRRGARARLQTIQPILSPVIWTSMATGRSPADHGILDFLGTDARGNAVPVTSNLRRKKAFWNVLSDAGASVGVVGWWATWPAEPVNGFLVSDRVAYQLFEVDETKIPTTGKVYPAALWDEISPLVVRPADTSPAELQSFLDASVESPLDAQDRQLLEQFRGVQAQAHTYAGIALRLHERIRPRVGAYYFESPDTACHLFMRFAPPRLPEIDATRQRRFGPVVERTYEFHDRLLARFVEAADEKTVVIVVSDHGFRSGPARPAHDSRVETPTAADWHERFGVFVAAGPGIRAGTEVDEASILDVFPTLLALLGMPVANDLEGKVLTRALTDEFLAAHPVRSTDTFEGSPAATKPSFAEASAEDRAIIESLIAIGYVGTEALGGGSGEPGATVGGTTASANVHNNTGTVLLEQGEFEAAITEFRRAVALAPTFPPARINLAHALVRLGRAKEAEEHLQSVLSADPANARALSLLSAMQLDEGRLVEAATLARTAVERDPRSPAGWHTLGRVEEKAGRSEAARSAFQRAAELDPDNPEPLNALGNSHETRGEYAEAARWYEKALAVDPSFAGAYNNLGLQQQRLGRRQEALKTYEEGRRRMPSSSILLNNIATWHHVVALEQLDLASRAEAAGRMEEAEAARARGRAEADAATKLYSEAIAANPVDASAVNNLGALRGALGEADKQLELYRRAVEIDPRYADAWHNIGLWYHDRQRWSDAHESFARVLAIDADYLPALRLDAHALLQLGRADESLRVLQSAAARNPRSASLLAAIGGLQDELGRPADACRNYRASLAIAPDQPQLRARIATLCGG